MLTGRIQLIVVENDDICFYLSYLPWFKCSGSFFRCFCVSGISYWGAGVEVFIIPDTSFILITGLVFSQEYGEHEVPESMPGARQHLIIGGYFAAFTNPKIPLLNGI